MGNCRHHAGYAQEELVHDEVWKPSMEPLHEDVWWCLHAWWNRDNGLSAPSGLPTWGVGSRRCLKPSIVDMHEEGARHCRRRGWRGTAFTTFVSRVFSAVVGNYTRESRRHHTLPRLDIHFDPLHAFQITFLRLEKLINRQAVFLCASALTQPLS
jgi:hypothetical protein